MEEHLLRILFEALAVAFCMVLAILFRKWFVRRIEKRMPKRFREDYGLRRSWRFRHAWALAAGDLFPFVAVIAPMREELMFRALLIAVFTRFDALAIIAILLSSVVFGRGHYKDQISLDAIRKDIGKIKVAHMFVARFIFATCLGTTLACIGIWSGSLWFPVALHVGWNGLLFILGHTPLLVARLQGRTKDARRLAIEMRRSIANKFMYLS